MTLIIYGSGFMNGLGDLYEDISMLATVIKAHA